MLKGLTNLTKYEEELERAKELGLAVYEGFHFCSSADGMIVGSKIALSDKLTTSAEKLCVLAEEIAHSEVSVRNILDARNPNNRHEEVIARRKAHDRVIGIPRLAEALKSGCSTFYEVSEYLGVTESFLREAIEQYSHRYGKWLSYEGKWLSLEPLGLLEIKE